MVVDMLPGDVERFINENLDSVPQLETLLLLRDSSPRAWTAEEVARRIYLPTERTAELLAHLESKGWLASLSGAFLFRTGTRDDGMIAQLAALYRENLVGVAQAIHRKPDAVLDFARAFRVRKDPP